MSQQDVIQRFLFKDQAIRGQRLLLNQAWLSMIKDRHYPQALQELLGELTAFSALLANGIKHPGKITLQVQGEGPVNLLVVEVTHQLKLKGMAKTNQPITDQTNAESLLGQGQILLSLENSLTDHLYQSYVSREGDQLVDALQHFLSQSEQLDTRLWISVSDQAVGALYLQKMPDTEAADADAWDRIQHLASTVKDQELLELDNTTLLTRLFHEEVVEVFEAKPLVYECLQDRERVATMLKSLGEEEARKLLEEQGEIVVFNEMCNYHERFNSQDLDALFGTQ
ncbi:Hsp33 family molecular chaperone HslO [Thiomicrospira microaerophila]|uniref:Hsp33 family molecular chaperone HslO n=1 Tax=Thiomicrospira microaerophila TaxID=406020 RepID=UPI00200FEDBF|nr:Hsp33 family molecular chaperone HslO [Thiomicrospira microaerophila]UQB41769.1 Hsp33 family molecular chaperone HslO [Thiomicrospira microaerophila]